MVIIGCSAVVMPSKLLGWIAATLKSLSHGVIGACFGGIAGSCILRVAE
jgi:uncharacterized membrane protein YeaQ/YmgE (transglycosylase-associated protein family)